MRQVCDNWAGLHYQIIQIIANPQVFGQTITCFVLTNSGIGNRDS